MSTYCHSSSRDNKILSHLSHSRSLGNYHTPGSAPGTGTRQVHGGAPSVPPLREFTGEPHLSECLCAAVTNLQSLQAPPPEHVPSHLWRLEPKILSGRGGSFRRW